MCIKIFCKSALAVECFILCFLRSAQETDISVFFLVHWLLPFCARQILQELGSHFSSIDVFLSKNDVLFYWKRRLVLLKTTCCFTENDVLFYWKRRVVFFRWWISHFSALQEDENNGKLNCENTYNNPLSRVRVRAHITGVLSFLLSQVSQTSF